MSGRGFVGPTMLSGRRATMSGTGRRDDTLRLGAFFGIAERRSSGDDAAKVRETHSSNPQRAIPEGHPERGSPVLRNPKPLCP